MNIMQISESHPVIVYDGYCLLCDRIIQFVLKADKKERFRFCTLEYFCTLYPDQAQKDRVMLLYHHRMSFGSDAAIDIMRELGGVNRLFSVVASFFPHVLREWVYQFIAARRYAWFGKSHTCIMPPTAWKSKFLDNQL